MKKVNNIKGISRRKLLAYAPVVSFFAFLSMGISPARLFAMSRRPGFNGFYLIKGKVLLNGQKAMKGDLIKAGDKVVTGEKSKAIIVSGHSAFLVRDNSEIEFPKPLSEEVKDKVIREINILKGKLLSVFGKGKRQITTSTAVIGVRGTGIYIESLEKSTYVCTCYGIVDIASKDQPELTQTVNATHHDKPLFVKSKTKGDPFEKAGMMNHSDSELIELESLVGRQPPFYDPNNPDHQYY